MSADRLAIDGGNPVCTGGWPQWPVWDQTEEAALLETLHSGQWWSVGGRQVAQFESRFAALQGARHCTAVTNGTAALEVVLRAAGIGCGDEVIIPPYTFMATASSVLAVGAKPVFVDVEPRSLNIDPLLIDSAVTARTRAIIPVHIGGCPADMDGVLDVARRHGLLVLEDAAQAVCASWKGQPVGAIGDAGTFSFQASKNLNSGEGGAIVCNDETLADLIWSVHNCGRPRGGRWYEHRVPGGNFRMTEFQAAILLAQMTRLEDQATVRECNAALLSDQLRGIPGITPPRMDPRVTRNAWHLYILRYDSEAFGGRSRDAFLAALEAEGVTCGAGYVPLYKEALFTEQAAMRGLCQAHDSSPQPYCPVTEKACRDEVVWLFQHMLLAEPERVMRIAEAIHRIQRHWG